MLVVPGVDETVTLHFDLRNLGRTFVNFTVAQSNADEQSRVTRYTETAFLPTDAAETTTTW